MVMRTRNLEMMMMMMMITKAETIGETLVRIDSALTRSMAVTMSTRAGSVITDTDQDQAVKEEEDAEGEEEAVAEEEEEEEEEAAVAREVMMTCLSLVTRLMEVLLMAAEIGPPDRTVKETAQLPQMVFQWEYTQGLHWASSLAGPLYTRTTGASGAMLMAESSLTAIIVTCSTAVATEDIG